MRLLALAALAAVAAAQGPFGIFRPQFSVPKDFAVMAWGNSPADPELLRGMREAGINIAGFCRAEELDRVRDAGLTCFVRDARANGYSWASLPPEADLRRNIAALKAQVGSHPAALGFYLRDEPDPSLMPGLGKVAGLLREAMPDKWAYVNVFPYRAGPGSRFPGASSYMDYVRMLVNTVGQPFLSYDNYSLVNGEMLDGFFTNLEIVSRLGLETRTPFWNCILANAHFNYMQPSDATFHLQVYSTLAYGGRGIQYFTYTTPQIGNYRLGAVDQFGNRTSTWEMLRRINNEIHALAPTLIKLRSTGVYHYPDAPEQGKGLAESRLVRSVEMTQRYVRPPAGARYLIGEFEDDQARPYLMIVNKDLSQSFRFRIELKRPEGKLLRISPYSGREENFGSEMDWLAPGAGVLLRVQ
jgi:hypothetical protein